jgi:hypothetical protein
MTTRSVRDLVNAAQRARFDRHLATRISAGFAAVLGLVLGGPVAAEPAPLPSSPTGAAGDAARDGDTDAANARAAAVDNRLNLRVGGASTDANGRPTICLEVRAWSALSMEGCGTGAGVLHGEDGAEMAHFRAKWRVDRRVAWGGLLQTQLGFGLAELQLGDDDPGFRIRPSGRRVEAAGPEVSASVQWLRPVTQSWELMVTTTAGAAWIPGAGDLVEARSQAQPFVALDLGVGW